MDKILVEVPYKDYDDCLQHEKVEAIKSNNFYQIIHAPFFAINLAYGDLIEVEKEDDLYYFNGHIQESEYSTIHIVFFNNEKTSETKAYLESNECTCCVLKGHDYMSVNVPPGTAYSNIHEYLQQQEKLKVSSFKEACLSDKHHHDIS